MTPFRFISAGNHAVSATIELTVDRGVRAVRIVSDAPILYATAPQTPDTGALIPTGIPAFFLVSIGDTLRFAPATKGSTGNVNVAFLTR